MSSTSELLNRCVAKMRVSGVQCDLVCRDFKKVKKHWSTWTNYLLNDYNQGRAEGGLLGPFGPGLRWLMATNLFYLVLQKKIKFWKLATQIQNGPGPQVPLRGPDYNDWNLNKIIKLLHIIHIVTWNHNLAIYEKVDC